MAHVRWLTKRGFAVRMPSGAYRGVYRDRSVARLNQAIAAFNERSVFDAVPTIVPCRIRPWTRYGVHTTPMEP